MQNHLYFGKSTINVESFVKLNITGQTLKFKSAEFNRDFFGKLSHHFNVTFLLNMTRTMNV